MDNSVYFKRVLTFLKQELPEQYRDGLELGNDKFILRLPETVRFQDSYQVLFPLITRQVTRIRDRQTDLHFTIKTNLQERDFSIFKQNLADA